MAVSIYIPTSSARRFPVSTPSPALVCRVSDDGHSDQCEVISSHCSFDLNFSNNKWYWKSFHVVVSHVSSLEKCLFRSFAHFLIRWLLFFSGIELYESLVYFGNQSFVSCFICHYFLLFWGLSFHLVYSFLHYTKSFKFNQVPLIFIFISITLGGGS